MYWSLCLLAISFLIIAGLKNEFQLSPWPDFLKLLMIQATNEEIKYFID